MSLSSHNKGLLDKLGVAKTLPEWIFVVSSLLMEISRLLTEMAFAALAIFVVMGEPNTAIR